MREIWTLDAETDPFKAGRIPKPFIWGAYNGSEYREFKSTDSMVEFFIELDVIVYAHNGGKFDYHFMLHHLQQFDPIMVISGRLAKFKIGLCEFRDSMNILPFALSVYQKDEIDYAIFEKGEREKPRNKKLISDYLKSDCVYLWDMVTQFIDRYGLNLTQAGAALKVWQKISGEKAPETTRDFYESLSKFYYGGRVECFHAGLIKHDFKVIDINSAYPFAMKHAHPYGEQFTSSDHLPKTTKKIQQSFITLECVSRGALPFRGKSGLSFPNDNIKRRYDVTGWEFLTAIKTRTIEDYEILNVLTFPSSIRFDSYIDYFYQQKDECKKNGDKAGYIFAKLFLNSLYGKFGSNPDNYNEYQVVNPRYIEASEDEGYKFCAELDRWALMSKPLDEEKQRYYNVAVAASITGFVRAYMWESINACEGVLYCDTDSIACSATGALELDPSKLGAWDIEAECNYGGIAGKKLYAFHDKNTDSFKTASKGVRLSAQEILKVAEGQEITYKPIAPSFSLKRGIKFVSRKVNKNVVSKD